MMSNRVFLNSFTQNACFGREKEASDLTPKASADLSDFLTSTQSSPKRREKGGQLASRSHGRTFTSWSSCNQRPSRLYLRYLIVRPIWRARLYMSHQCSVKSKFIIQKKNPAYAVYCWVLNLQKQVGPYLETPPWLRPIALFLIKLRTLLKCIGSKRKGNIANTEGLWFLYHNQGYKYS